MTNKEYMFRKNEIVKAYTGATLIPKEQIVDITVTSTMVNSMAEYVYEQPQLLDASNCPYCAEYYTSTDYDQCANCPMFEAGNSCGGGYGRSTYLKCSDKVDSLEEDYDAISKELVSLAEEYIESNKHLIEEK